MQLWVGPSRLFRSSSVGLSELPEHRMSAEAASNQLRWAFDRTDVLRGPRDLCRASSGPEQAVGGAPSEQLAIGLGIVSSTWWASSVI